jgi:CRP-like cAMP-binding protein
MNTSVILAHISEYVTLDEEEKEYLSSVLICQTVRQGELIVKKGDPGRYMVHANSGYLMTYYTDASGSDHVVQFASAGWWTGDLYSMAKNVPTIYSTRALTDSEVLLLPKVAHEQLLQKYMKFERYFRIIFQNGLMRLQYRLMESHSASAEERYRSFRERYPNMEQHVPQKYIASYLGITPEFLSKLRKKISTGLAS